MDTFKLVVGAMPYSDASRKRDRANIRSTNYFYGPFAFYMTISPADTYGWLSFAFAGGEFDLNYDDLPPGFDDRTFRNKLAAASNSVGLAQFFHAIMTIVLDALDPTRLPGESDMDGILGKINAYYGAVEGQNRGTLHCHLVVWLDQCPSPGELHAKLRENKELRRRLKDYLDEVIKRDLSQFPDDGIPPNVDTSQKASNSPPLDPFVEDNCVLQCACRYRIRKGIKQYQYHCCTATCQKGNFVGCRLRMPKSTRDKSVYDFKSGLLLLKQVDGYVNNFNL
jgi:hypothetical protein